MDPPPEEPTPTPAPAPDPPAQEAHPAPASAAGTLSPDGRWVWDGAQWQPAAGAPMGGYGDPAAYGGGFAPVSGPAPGLAYAGFWIRVVAYLIDSAIIFALVFVLALVSGGITKTDPNTGVQTVNASVQVFAFLIGLAYVIGFWTVRSATPGQIALGMRILRVDNGAPLDAGKAVIRYIGYIIAVLPFGLGLIWAGFDPRKQGWHDKIAGTVVVRSVPV
ncbi:MAG TPA: RDD family protein [Candidatus Dormibacteraeota bacterium]|nr:RDD family protein [Candidatus Dormibacteraeota bacterium]